MKKIILTAAALAMTAGSAFGFGSAASTTGITGTAHDIPSSMGGAATQKCVYCHTPHNPNRNVPLWNRLDKATITAVYNSPTLTTAGKGAVVGSDTVSSFCMSCHDGSTAMGAIKNSANLGAANLASGAIGATRLANLGSLTNDHPVGFSYNNAYLEDTGGTKEARLFAPSVVATKMNQVNPPFFGTAGDQMECASCHKVHDNRVAPFLRYTNDASKLCLACHVK